MSRSGYTDDCDHLGLYRANVRRTIYGKTGQAFLREMAAALDAMPVKELVDGDLVREDGACCAIGSVCVARGMSVDGIDITDPEAVGKAMGISRILAAEIEFLNDDDFDRPTNETPAKRWTRMRQWVAEHIDD